MNTKFLISIKNMKICIDMACLRTSSAIQYTYCTVEPRDRIRKVHFVIYTIPCGISWGLAWLRAVCSLQATGRSQ